MSSNDAPKDDGVDGIIQPIEKATEYANSAADQVEAVSEKAVKKVEDSLDAAEQKLDDFVSGLDSFLKKF